MVHYASHTCAKLCRTLSADVRRPAAPGPQPTQSCDRQYARLCLRAPWLVKESESVWCVKSLGQSHGNSAGRESEGYEWMARSRDSVWSSRGGKRTRERESVALEKETRTDTRFPCARSWTPRIGPIPLRR